MRYESINFAVTIEVFDLITRGILKYLNHGAQSFGVRDSAEKGVASKRRPSRAVIVQRKMAAIRHRERKSRQLTVTIRFALAGTQEQQEKTNAN